MIKYVFTLFILCLVCLLGACTYGPPKTRYMIEDSARKPDSYQAVVIVYKETTRPPTGISTFPNGGVSKLISSSVSFYLINILTREKHFLLKMPVPDKQHTAFSAGIIGWQGDNIYGYFDGCEGNECYPPLNNHSFFRLKQSGDFEQIGSVNKDLLFQGQSWAPMQGEKTYARLSVNQDSISAILESGGQAKLLFMLNPGTGELELP